MDNAKRISEALCENNSASGGTKVTDEEIQRQAEELERHSLYLNENSRLHLVHALSQGRIGADEFKRRAITNDPHGSNSRCHTAYRSTACRFI